MGLGTPTAVGAAAARPEALSVCIAGDGGGMMGIIEFSTAVRYDLPFLMVVLNDAAYDAEYDKLKVAGFDPAACFMRWPEFADVAVGLGGRGVTVRSEAELVEAIEDLPKLGRQVLIDTSSQTRTWTTRRDEQGRQATCRIGFRPPLDGPSRLMDRQKIVEASVRSFLADDTAARALGITVSHVAPGEVTAHMTVTVDMTNGHGSAHGCALFAVADIAFAMACNSHEHMAIGRSCNFEYLAPAFPGQHLTATAVERSAVGRGAIYDVAITRDEDGQLLAELRAHSRHLTAKPASLARHAPRRGRASATALAFRP